jgi:hypothetical protein
MIRANDDQLRKLLLGQQQLVQEVADILGDEQKKDDVLSAVVLSSHGEHVNRIARLDPDRVFSEKDLRRICVIYRLRFLDAGCFKGKLPPKALYELRRLDARSKDPLKGFKILAPAVRFRRSGSAADPMLFVSVGPSLYYLVYKWGKNLSPWRALSVWPLRSAWNLGATVLLLAVLISLFLPNQLVGYTGTAWWGGHRLLALLWSSMVLASVVAFTWFTFFGRFSPEVWKEKRLG